MRTSTAFLSLAFLTILGCGTHSLEDLLNAGSSSSEASSSLPSSSSLSSSSEAISSSSSSSSGNGGGSGSLTYQGQTYRTVVIGTLTWMAENLNYNASGSKCYDDDPANCVTYGRLYDWATAMALPSSCNSTSTSCSGQVNAKHRGVCPIGWHIPSVDDWDSLINYVENDKGCSMCAGAHLKAVGWRMDGHSRNSYGFSALPSDGRSFGYWWSASEYNGNNAYSLDINYRGAYADLRVNDKSSLYSVRCLQD